MWRFVCFVILQFFVFKRLFVPKDVMFCFVSSFDFCGALSKRFFVHFERIMEDQFYRKRISSIICIIHSCLSSVFVCDISSPPLLFFTNHICWIWFVSLFLQPIERSSPLGQLIADWSVLKHCGGRIRLPTLCNLGGSDLTLKLDQGRTPCFGFL